MKYVYSLFLLLFLLSGVSFAQQILDPQNYITVDNYPNTPTSGNDADSSTSVTDEYFEYRGWYTSASNLSWGGGHRQKSRLGGAEVIGATATWVINIPPEKGGTYLIYDYVLQSTPNNASNVFFTLKREFESENADSIRHDLRRSTWDYMNGVTLGAWVPIMINTFSAGSKAYVTMGADSASGPTIMRADAIRFLRSTATGADMEVGKRSRDGFDSVRLRELWLDSPIGSINYQDFPIFNIGKEDLIVSDVHGLVTPNRWLVRIPNNGSFPLVVPPGEKRIIQVGFRPFQEEQITDTLEFLSNDSAETSIKIPVFGTGVNYNFILNASNTNEPNYNAPFDEIGNEQRPQIILNGAFLNSTAASFPYPIPSGNRASIVNTSMDPATSGEYVFYLPDSVNGQPGSTGFYYIEWGILGGSTNGCSNAKVRIVTPFVSDTIKTTTSFQFGAVAPLASFSIVGGRSYLLNQGGPTKVKFSYVTWDDPSPAGGFMRLDLLRIRKVPTGASIAAKNFIDFNKVSIYENERLIQNNYHTDLEISSNGESALVIDSVVLADNKFKRFYNLKGLPEFPAMLPAINGTLKFTVEFLPDSIADSLWTTLRIYSNDTLSSPFSVTLHGEGIGTALTIEESDIQSSYVYPADPVIYPDLANMDKWQTISGGSGGSRLVGYIYHLKGDPANDNKAYVEYFPSIPMLEGKGVELDTFSVYAAIPAGSSNGSPAAKYSIFPSGGNRVDSIVNQNGRAGSTKYLGDFVFLRSGSRDAHGGAAINGYIRLENDTALVNAYYKDSLENIAKRDTFVLRADAIILYEKNLVMGVGYKVYPNIPDVYSLNQNFPNPFNPTTQIRFGLPQSENVTLKIYDILGREVRQLINERYDAGTFTVAWDGKNNQGIKIAS
ncbi:MAG: hypothetical protein H3C35_10330, partial [Bacteroidetes bacterium]|nr:hypothetical protein [Bacteroidota bacterium]